MPKQQYSIRLSDEVLKRLREESKKRQRSVANLIELMVREKFDMV